MIPRHASCPLYASATILRDSSNLAALPAFLMSRRKDSSRRSVCAMSAGPA